MEIGFFQKIHDNYGETTRTNLNDYLRTTCKVAKLKEQTSFLTKCRRHNLFPKHLDTLNLSRHYYNDKYKQKSDELIKQVKLQLLNFEIGDTFLAIKRFDIELHKFNDYFKKTLNILDHNKLNLIINNRKKYTSKQFRYKLNKKFTNLYNNHYSFEQKFLNFDCKKWIKNLSSTYIPSDIMKFLSLGPDFGVPYTCQNLPSDEIICGFEQQFNAKVWDNFKKEKEREKEKDKELEKQKQKEFEELQRKEKETHNNLRNELANILRNSKNSLKLTQDNRVILRLYEKTLDFISRHNKKIFVTKADKGNITVILNKSDYLTKAKRMLNDKKTYKVLKKDPTTKYQNKFNTLIKFWLKKEYITQITADKLLCDTGTISKFYALPKVHKLRYPFKTHYISL